MDDYDPLVFIRKQYVCEIEDILQCIVCWERPLEEILTCATGHHICKKCSETQRICPSCKQGYNGSRNCLAEALSAKFEQIKTSIEKPNHQINKKVLDNKKCTYTQTKLKIKSAETQTISGDSSVHTQTELSEVFAETQTDLSGVSTETQTDNQLQTDPTSLVSGNDETLSVPCFIKTCNHKSLYNQIVSHIKRCHKDDLLKLNACHKDLFKTTLTLIYESNESYHRAINISDGSLFLFNILIDGEGNLHGHIERVDKGYNEQQFYYSILIPNEKEPLQSKFFKGIVSNYCEIGTIHNENIFISNSLLFSCGLLKENRWFDCSLSLYRPED